MKITRPIVHICENCRLVRVRGRVTLRHTGNSTCTSRRAEIEDAA